MALAGGRHYTTHFVRMEFRRVLIYRLALLCLQLDLPAVKCADDLLASWENNFGARDAKFVSMIARRLIPTGIDIRSPARKQDVFRVLADVAMQWEFELQEETKAPLDSGPRCKRALPSLQPDATHPEDIRATFKEFTEAFADEAGCRAGCSIDGFLSREAVQISQWITGASSVTGDARRSMLDLASKASQATTQGLGSWTCKDCGRLGDWIIALDCPADLQIEHIDHVYDHLCPSRGLSNRKHAPDRIDLTQE